ncbi:hypothetical protein EMCRGX_G026058 [Ephydatia muelleri]
MSLKSAVYRPMTPTNNIIIQRNCDIKAYAIHRKKVDNALPLVDNKPSQRHNHMHTRLKKRQMEEERQAVIQKDNQILLENMAHIMSTKGRLDNRNEYKQKSLNVITRQRELIRIMHENRAILKRIHHAEASHDRMQLEARWKVITERSATISKSAPAATPHKQKPLPSSAKRSDLHVNPSVPKVKDSDLTATQELSLPSI